MTYELFDKQGEFASTVLNWERGEDGIYRNNADLSCYIGCVRGGKSVAGLALLILLCKLFPGSRWIVVRESIETIKRTTLPDFYEIIPPERLKSAPAAGKMNPWTAIIGNKGQESSQIMFFGENFDKDPQLMRWRGLACNGFLLEEGNELRFDSYLKSIERKGTWKMGKTWPLKMNGKPVQCYPSINMVTCNPADNWLKTEIYDKHRDGTLDSRVKVIKATAFDNPHVPPSWIEEKRRLMPDVWFKRFILGDWDAGWNDAPWLLEWDESRHIYRGDWEDLDMGAEIFLSCDQNVEPPAATAWQRGKGWVHCLAESDIERGSVYDIADWVKRRFSKQVAERRIRITGDASGHKRVAETKNNDSFYKILATLLGLNPDAAVVAPRYNERLEHSRTLCNSVFRAHPRLLIHHECKRTIGDLTRARVKKDGTLDKDEQRKDVTKFLDFFDTVRYAIQTFFPDWLEGDRQYL